MNKMVYRLKQATVTVTRLNEPDVPTGNVLARLLTQFNQLQKSVSALPLDSAKRADLQYKMRCLRESMGHVREKRPKKKQAAPTPSLDKDIQSGMGLKLKYKTEAKSPRKYLTFSVLVQLNHWSKFSKSYTIELNDDAYLLDGIRRQVSSYRKHAIQRQRAEVKYQPYNDIFVEGLNAVYSGSRKTPRVFMKEGQVLKAYIKRNLKALFEDKKPTNKSNYLGVEIEFCAPITEDQLAITLFRSGFHKFVQLKQDGSLRPQKGETGFEFAMLLRESSYKKDLKSVCDLIASVKGTGTDRRCGLHIHFDMRKRDKDVVFNNLVSCQNVLWSLVDPRRYDNEFCRNVNSKKFPTKFNNTREERYKTINAAAYYRHKTLEVRMHEGTVDFKDMTNWIDVLLKIVNYDKKMKNDIGELQTLKKRVRLNSKVYKAVVDKTCFWQVNQADHVARAIQAQDALARDTMFRMEQAELERDIAQGRVVPRPIPGGRMEIERDQQAEQRVGQALGDVAFRELFFPDPVTTVGGVEVQVNNALAGAGLNATWTIADTEPPLDPTWQDDDAFEDTLDNDTE